MGGHESEGDMTSFIQNLLSIQSRHSSPEGLAMEPADTAILGEIQTDRMLSGGCDGMCTMKGHTDTCRNRVEWVRDNQHKTLDEALDVVNSDCLGQCQCSESDFTPSPTPAPSPAPTPAPPIAGRCDDACTVKGHTDTCRNRVEWVRDNQHKTLDEASDIVNSDCLGQCQCSGSDPTPTPSPTPAPTPGPTPAPPIARGCDDACTVKGHADTCRNRINWVMGPPMQKSLDDAILLVSSDCADQCLCSAADFQLSPTPAPPTPPTRDGRGVRVLSFNVWHGNNHFSDIAELIQFQVNADFANLQEAVGHQPGNILSALNSAAGSGGAWALANPWTGNPFWGGLNFYRSDVWSLEWHTELPYQGDRGVCGARFRRISDGVKYCIWGTHPLWRAGAPPPYAQEGITVAGADMKGECASAGAASVFVGDMNTMDYEALRVHLQATTGGQWKVAAHEGYDQIFTETSPQNAGVTTGATVIGAHSGPAGCQASCQNPKWAYADHPPVYVDIDPPVS